MIKVTVMYPYTEGARFDHAYYRDRHMPMVKARLGSACAYYTVDKGLAGRAPGAPPAFVAMCAFICDSAEGYEAAMREHRAGGPDQRDRRRAVGSLNATGSSASFSRRSRPRHVYPAPSNAVVGRIPESGAVDSRPGSRLQGLSVLDSVHPRARRARARHQGHVPDRREWIRQVDAD